MKINEYHQITFENLLNSDIDLLICSSGYESRASHLAKQLYSQKIERKVVLSFNDRLSDLSRPMNDEYFKSKNFQPINCDGDLENEVTEFLESFLLENSKHEINIIVDYSSMTRIWYGSILKYFQFKQCATRIVNVIFCYTIAKYVKSPQKQSYNIHIGPIRGFTSISVPQKPTALIIGLGYERNRAMGLYEYFDGETFLFYTDDSKESKYSEEVKANNSEIMHKTKNPNKYEYPINDMNYTNRLLTSLCNELFNDYRIIIAPCGPKPFTLLSLIIALRYENVDAWRISSGKESFSIDKEAEGEIIVYKVSFT